MDYTGAVCWEKKLSIDRKLNAPAICAFALDADGLAMPARNGRVRVIADNGAVMFTGYVARDAEQEFAGVGLAGASYRVKVDAVGDEFAMDRTPLPQRSAANGQTVATMLRDLTQLAPGGVDASGVSSGVVVGSYAAGADQSWSAHASALANASRSAYRVIDGTLTLQTAGSVVHALSDSGGTLNLANLNVGAVRELASDVTLTGQPEPATYVTEVFQGDGTTLTFDLTRTPFAVRHKAILDDSFTEAAAFDPSVWRVSDPGSRFSLTGTGIAVSGGNGVDGQTTLTAALPLEIGGELVLEAGAAQLNVGSDGVLCAAYVGVPVEANCFVGFRVRQNNGVTLFVPVVNGVETGTAFATVSGHAYVLRIRVHAAELYRAAQTYYVDGQNGIQQYGGELIASPVSVLFEVRDSAASANALSNVLYDGALASSPSLCTFVALNSTGLQGSVGYFRVTQPGTAWVTSQAAQAPNAFSRRIGLAADGAECTIEKGGKLRFYKASAPAVGELVRVSYRTAEASIARIATVGSAGSSGFWAGKVERPAARTSEDCENAAAAVLAFSADPAASLRGSYVTANMQQNLDVWPGDALVISSVAQTLRVIVRAVKIAVDASMPEMATYQISFANDWAEGLSVKLANGITSTARVPVVAQTAVAQVAGTLPRLAVTGLSPGAIAVNANATPAVGGGFEVRRRDGNFGAGAQQDLVLRSTTPDFTLPRAAEKEQFFVRMYDGAVPPRYSRFSSAIFIDAAMS